MAIVISTACHEKEHMDWSVGIEVFPEEWIFIMSWSWKSDTNLWSGDQTNRCEIKNDFCSIDHAYF
jgi:hypothetical protein